MAPRKDHNDAVRERCEQNLFSLTGILYIYIYIYTRIHTQHNPICCFCIHISTGDNLVVPAVLPVTVRSENREQCAEPRDSELAGVTDNGVRE